VTATKISEDIDGTFQYLDTSFPISGGSPQVLNILQASFLMKQLNDPVFGNRVIVANYFDEKWWFANYNCTVGSNGQLVNDVTVPLKFVTTGLNGSIPCLFGIMGNKLYQLYQNTASSPPAQWLTPLWPMEDSLSDKEIFRAGFELTIESTGSSGTITATIDTTNGSTQFYPPSYNTAISVGNVQWINNSNTSVSWQNNSSQIVTWFNGSYLLYVGDGLGAFSKYIGMTGVSSAGWIYELNSNMMDYSLRKRW
jgi:hypothetical protein